MAISLRPDRVKRYAGVARLLWKYGRSDVVRQAGLEDALEDEERPEGTAEAGELAADLERLGPTYVKLGQLLSTRADLLPVAWLEDLARLQDDVEQIPFADVETVVEAELEVRISKAFSRFDPEPLAAASLGQVHYAELRDGRRVAVKVQRPDVRERIREDLEAFEEIAGFLDQHTEWGERIEFSGLVEEFGTTLRRELDYRQEAAHLETFAENLKEFDRIVIPRPIEDYSTDRVLTMEFIDGRKVTAFGPLARLELDGEPLADQLFEAYLKQVLVDGLFHADPHPGNVFVTVDGRLGLIDLGMVSRVPRGMRERLLKLVLAVGEGDGGTAADAALDMGETIPERLDERELRRRVGELVGRVEHATVADLEVGKVVMEISAIAMQCGVRVPRELTMLGRALLSLDAVARVLAPDFDPNAAIRRHAAELTRRRMTKDFSPGAVFRSALETAEMIQEMPARLNRILGLLANNELAIRVDSLDERTLIEGFQKVANRIAAGLVLAALIVGAAMLMRVQTDFTLFGYPGLAMLCFLGAVAGGLLLLLDILRHDRQVPRERGDPRGS